MSKRPQSRSRTPVDASMTLLNEVMHRPLDPGYAAAAARRKAGTQQALSRPGAAAIIAIAIVLGLIATTATIQLRAPQPSVMRTRDLLVAQVREREANAQDSATKATALTAEIETLQRAALAGVSPQLLARIRTDGLNTGTVPVDGPGLVVTLSDGTREGGSSADEEGDSAVQDSDLQHVVNALWAGGAEAISVNDQRLTTLSAIRSAGSAILVDLQPLTAPYHVRAIGDPEAMQVELARSGTTDLLRLLGTRYGIHSSVAEQSSLRLPGTGTPTLYYATVIPRPVESTQSSSRPQVDEEPQPVVDR